MSIEICGCGLIKQGKAGLSVRDGIRICNNCGLPADATDVFSISPIAELLGPIAPARITTLQSLPGFRVVDVLGVVSELTSASGWTAESKGNSALNAAMSGLSRTATTMGANAVIGLFATTFGAHGGITSGFGGDAVGVLLMGTAVVVEESVAGQPLSRILPVSE